MCCIKLHSRVIPLAVYCGVDKTAWFLSVFLEIEVFGLVCHYNVHLTAVLSQFFTYKQAWMYVHVLSDCHSVTFTHSQWCGLLIGQSLSPMFCVQWWCCCPSCACLWSTLTVCRSVGGIVWLYCVCSLWHFWAVVIPHSWDCYCELLLVSAGVSVHVKSSNTSCLSISFVQCIFSRLMHRLMSPTNSLTCIHCDAVLFNIFITATFLHCVSINYAYNIYIFSTSPEVSVHCLVKQLFSMWHTFSSLVWMVSVLAA